MQILPVALMPVVYQPIPMGSEVKSVVTGFRGLVTGRLEYFNGCVQYLVAPPLDKDGKLPDAIWMDEYHLEVVGEGIRMRHRSALERSFSGGASSSDPKPPTMYGA